MKVARSVSAEGVSYFNVHKRSKKKITTCEFWRLLWVIRPIVHKMLSVCPVIGFNNISFHFFCVLLSSLVDAAWQSSCGSSHILSGQSRTCGNGSEPGAVQRPAGGQRGPLCGSRSPSSPGKILEYKYTLWSFFSCLLLHSVLGKMPDQQYFSCFTYFWKGESTAVVTVWVCSLITANSWRPFSAGCSEAALNTKKFCASLCAAPMTVFDPCLAPLSLLSSFKSSWYLELLHSDYFALLLYLK